jgi:hypothetical protein
MIQQECPSGVKINTWRSRNLRMHDLLSVEKNFEYHNMATTYVSFSIPLSLHFNVFLTVFRIRTFLVGSGSGRLGPDPVPDPGLYK